MSIVSKPRPRINADDVPVVVAGTEHRDRGEPIPARPRPRPFSPSQAEAEAVAIAEHCAGLPSGSTAASLAFKVGAYESLYGELYQHFLDATATVERMRPHYYPFGLDEAELPDADYYEIPDGPLVDVVAELVDRARFAERA